MMRTDTRGSILVLGLGNLLLEDDAVGLELLKQLRERFGAFPGVDFVDGGTQGVALLGVIAGRESMLILDAVSKNAVPGAAEPGSVLCVDDPLAAATPQDFGAHGANASGLLASARLIGGLPEQISLVGVVPATTSTGVGLSETVRNALPEATGLASEVLLEMCDLEAPERRASCTS